MTAIILAKNEVKALTTEVTSGKLKKGSVHSSRYVAFVLRSAADDPPPSWALTVDNHQWPAQEGTNSEVLDSVEFEDAFIRLSDVSNTMSAKSQESLT